MKNKRINDIPKGWMQARISEICDLVNGRAFKPSEWSSQGLPIIRIQNLNNDQADYNYCNFEIDEKYYVESGQLLFAWSGTPGTSFGAHIWKGGRAVLNQHIFKVQIDEANLSKSFLMYLFNRNVDEYIGKAHGTAGLAHITKGKFDSSLVCLPPLPEQHRIVAKIEELLTRLDAGVKALNAVKAQLKRYRQSVLKSAFEGKLTAEWRAAHRHELEPAIKLLERIKTERKEKLGKKYKESTPIDTSALPELPEGWAWTRLDELGADESNAITDGPFGSNLKTSHYTDHGPRVVRLQNIGDGEFVDERAHIRMEHFNTLRKHQVFEGDLVVASLGSDPPRSCIIPGSLGLAIVKADCIRFKPHPLLRNKWINFALNSEPTKKWAAEVVHGVGRPRLNLGNIKRIPLPIPPAIEQTEIVSEIERCFSVADAIEKVVEQSLGQSERLRQSILKRAFEGKLVSQDPNDPPASELLERIRREREKATRESEERNKKRTTAGR